jgi:osmotically-inducible protein OsmY
MMRTIKSAVAIAVFTIALSPVAAAAVPEARDLTPTFVQAGASIDRLQVFEIAGIVIIRGRAADKTQAEEVGKLAQSLGYQRVANLTQVVANRDAELARAAERELTVNRSLDGCNFRVTSDQGVIRVAGEVKHELQKDVAMQVLRNVDGAKSIELTLNRF